jgi:hypothetical protein
LKALLHDKVDAFAEELVRSINAAKPGRLIADSEELVREAVHDWGHMAFEALVQEKIAAAEAAFSPSGGRQDGAEISGQGSAGEARADDQRTRQSRASLVAFAVDGKPGSGGRLDG